MENSEIKELLLDLKKGQEELFKGQDKLFKGQKELFEGQEETRVSIRDLQRGQDKLFKEMDKLSLSVGRIWHQDQTESSDTDECHSV